MLFKLLILSVNVVANGQLGDLIRDSLLLFLVLVVSLAVVAPLGVLELELVCVGFFKLLLLF